MIKKLQDIVLCNNCILESDKNLEIIMQTN